jgi:large subunit ribosomal protein L28
MLVQVLATPPFWPETVMNTAAQQLGRNIDGSGGSFSQFGHLLGPCEQKPTQAQVLGAIAAPADREPLQTGWYSVLLDVLSNTSFRKSVMSRVCQLTGKRANNGMAVSHSHVRTKKLQQVNLQERRLWWAEGNRFVKLRVSTRALKTIQKKGLGAYAKELGVNLAKV